MATPRLVRLPVTSVDGEEIAHLFSLRTPDGAPAADLTAGALVAEVVDELLECDLPHDKTVILPGLPELLGLHELVGLEDGDVAFAVTYDDLAEDEALEDAVQAQRALGRSVYVVGVQTVAQVEALAGYADVVVLDADVTDAHATTGVAASARDAGMAVLVTDVRTPEQRAAYASAGVMGTAGSATGRTDGALLPPRKVNVEALVALLTEELVAMEAVDAVVTGDAGLTLAVLEQARRIPREGAPVAVDSTRQALMHVGRKNIRAWAADVASSAIADPHQRETSSMILTRARFCEGLARISGTASPDEAFLAGLLAGVVDLLEVGAADLLGRVACSTAVAEALVDGHGPLGSVVSIARAHGTSPTGAREAGLSPLEVMRAYLDAVNIVSRTMRGDDAEDAVPVIDRPGQGELRRRLGAAHRSRPDVS